MSWKFCGDREKRKFFRCSILLICLHLYFCWQFVINSVARIFPLFSSKNRIDFALPLWNGPNMTDRPFSSSLSLNFWWWEEFPLAKLVPFIFVHLLASNQIIPFWLEKSPFPRQMLTAALLYVQLKSAFIKTICLYAQIPPLYKDKSASLLLHTFHCLNAPKVSKFTTIYSNSSRKLGFVNMKQWTALLIAAHSNSQAY